jgi:hypothetical protein
MIPIGTKTVFSKKRAHMIVKQSAEILIRNFLGLKDCLHMRTILHKSIDTKMIIKRENWEEELQSRKRIYKDH